MQSTVNSVTTTFVGSYYELTGSQVTKYYFAGAQRAAMRKYTIPQPMTVEYLLGDHLGSTSITTDSSGARVSEIRYKPWGEIRYSWTSGVATTPSYRLMNYTFTGQFSYMDDPTTTGTTEGFGLLFYNARMYDPAIGRFSQADTFIPGGVQGWDRYAYANNDPVKYTDPSGHVVSCDAEEDCREKRRVEKLNAIDYLKESILSKFGITMSEKSDVYNANPKAWNSQNLLIFWKALNQISDVALNGKLKELAGGATFKWGDYTSSPCGGGGTYCGYTYGTTITFYTIGQAAIRVQNIFHEFGHVLDNSPKTRDAFSHNPGINNSEFLDENGRLDYSALINQSHDMYQHNLPVYDVSPDDMLKAQNEHWADMFANYVAGNIDMAHDPGKAMNDFVEGALTPYIGTP